MTLDSAFVGSGRLPIELFGVPLTLATSDARELLLGLQMILEKQFTAAGKESSLPSLLADELPLRAEELQVFATWFDPTAKGERIRGELARLQRSGATFPYVSRELVVDIGDNRFLVTPEGWLILRCVRRAENRARANEERTGAPSGRRQISAEDAATSVRVLLDTYRLWTRRRIDDVVGLLTSETSTLRPAAAGLLFTLLVNRNTAKERALRRPSDPRQLAIVAEAVAAPALAYAEALSGRHNSLRSVDLYRGWALGELRRRLGPGFHVAQDEGIWLDETATEEAVRRLVDDVQRRSDRDRARVPEAVAAALAAYDARRPELAALELAFERPANTRRLTDTLLRAAGTEPENQSELDSPGSRGPTT